MRGAYFRGAMTSLASLCAGLLVACSATSTGTDAGTEIQTQISPVEMCERLAQARCELLARCFPAFLRDEPEACQNLEQARCLSAYETLRPSFTAKAVEVDSEKVLACETRMRNSACTPTFPPGYVSVAVHPFADCELTGGLFRGRTPSGQTCDHPIECAEGTVCIKPGGVCRGTCSTYAQEGEPCAFGCGEGLYCNANGTPDDPTDDRCQRLKSAGEVCASSRECAPDLYCRGTCRARGQEGEPCVFDPERLSTCAPGLACDVTPFVADQLGTCVKPGEAGDECRFHWSCAPGLVCADLDYTGFPQKAPAPGICQPPTPSGGGCLFTPYAIYVGDACGAGTVCVPEGTCSELPSLGDACEPSTQRCSGMNVYCKPSAGGSGGTCTGPASIGERCAFSLDSSGLRKVTIPCASGFCDTSSTESCQVPNKGLGQLCESDGECLSNRCAVQQDSSMRCAEPCL